VNTRRNAQTLNADYEWLKQQCWTCQEVHITAVSIWKTISMSILSSDLNKTGVKMDNVNQNQSQCKPLRFQIVMAGSMKMTVFWDGALCSLVSGVLNARNMVVMNIVNASETSVNLCETTQLNIPEDSYLQCRPLHKTTTKCMKWSCGILFRYLRAPFSFRDYAVSGKTGRRPR
jgi:hypothetical protein